MPRIARLRFSYVELFAGCGGLSRGLKDAGWEGEGVELDPDAVETHRANVGPCVLADVLHYSPARPARLVAGGPPCQPFSLQGKRLGENDPRGVLWREMPRVAAEANADLVLLENVPGFPSWRPKGDPSAPPLIERVVERFRAAGFPRCSYRLVNFADHGVPQARVRFVLVAFRTDALADAFAWPEPTHGPETGRPHVSLREALSLGPGVFRVGRRPGMTGWQGVRYVNVDRPAYTLGTRGNADWIAPENGPERRIGLDDMRILQGFPPGFAWRGRTAETRQRQCGNAVPPPIGKIFGLALRRALILAGL